MLPTFSLYLASKSSAMVLMCCFLPAISSSSSFAIVFRSTTELQNIKESASTWTIALTASNTLPSFPACLPTLPFSNQQVTSNRRTRRLLLRLTASSRPFVTFGLWRHTNIRKSQTRRGVRPFNFVDCDDRRQVFQDEPWVHRIVRGRQWYAEIRKDKATLFVPLGYLFSDLPLRINRVFSLYDLNHNKCVLDIISRDIYLVSVCFG